MNFKLAYKEMQDQAAMLSDALDSMKETREEFARETQGMLKELQRLSFVKLERFKATLMSAAEVHFDFEVDLTSIFDECQSQSVQTRKRIIEQDSSKEE